MTNTQLRILEALCRPGAGGDRYATPATNQEIADEVFLGVDAVKGHLRALYRKFGIEDLPQNQKRARLFELAIEGGYLGGEETPAPVPGESAVARHADVEKRPRRTGLLLGGAVAVVAVVLAVLALSGAFSSGGAASTTGVAAYKSALRGYCRLALSGQQRNPTGSTAQRAAAYLEVFETMRGRLESLPPPAGSDRDLDRFRDGLSGAANFTSIVAQGAPPAGGKAEAGVVAELTFAAGQVQAGALGYGLGPDCLAIGDLVARSAQNAAGAP